LSFANSDCHRDSGWRRFRLIGLDWWGKGWRNGCYRDFPGCPANRVCFSHQRSLRCSRRWHYHSIKTSHLHIRHQRSLTLHHRTQKVQCARTFRRQIKLGAGGEQRRIVVSRRGLVRYIEHTSWTSVNSTCGGGGFSLSSRKLPLSCMLPQRSGSIVCLRAQEPENALPASSSSVCCPFCRCSWI